MSEEVKEKGPNAHSKSMWIKILVLSLIVIAVAGVFFFKNQPQQDTDDQGKPSQPAAQNSAAGQEAEQTGGQAANSSGSTDIDYSSAEFDLDATESFDLDKILSYGLPVIVDFGADSCIPCQKMAPVLKELNEELRGKAIVKFVDVGKNPDAGSVVPLRVIPTQFFFDKDGKPYALSESADQYWVMYSAKDTNEHVFTAHEGGMTKDEILAVLKELGVE